MLNLANIGWLLLEGLLMVTICLAAFRARQRVGMGPLYVMIGGFQHMQTNLAATMYVEIAPGVQVSPGSAVIFVASLFVVLLIYLKEDALEARSLIYGIVFTNLALSLVGMLLFAHATYGDVTLLSEGYVELLVSSLRLFLAGTGALVIDVLLIIVLYEFISKYTQSLFLRAGFALVLVVLVDCLIFSTAAFIGTPQYVSILTSSVVGKVGMAVFYTTALVFYLRFFPSTQTHDPYALRDIFAHLTYRQRFDALSETAQRDDLSGLYNRGYFDRALERTLHQHDTVALVFLDIDDFKMVNDSYGHTSGDLVIQTLAEAMLQTFRGTDIVCRFGGDEFAAILPDVDRDTAKRATERLRKTLVSLCDPSEPVFEFGAIGVSIGIGCKPNDGATSLELVDAADRRLYRAKKTGKDQTSGFSEVLE